MVLKLHGAYYSTCTQRVVTTLKEKGVEFELVPVDLSKGEHKSASFLEKQPFGVIPVLEDDGFFVFESRAICRYIETKFKGKGTQLIPTELQAYGLFEQGASIETSYWDPQVSAITFENVFKGMYGGAPDSERVKQLTEKLTNYLNVYEKILAKQEFIGGHQFTLADIYHLPYGNYLFNEKVGLGHLINERPHVKAWWERITKRESWVEALKLAYH